MLVVAAEDVRSSGSRLAMPNFSTGSPEIEIQPDDAEGPPTRSGPRRRGRRGGRRRNNRGEGSPSSNGTMEPTIAITAADEKAVSQQLRLLMSPKLVKAEWRAEPAEEAADPQLTYRPPARIESFGAKPAEAPVSAATFKKNESPLQAVVATVGSMAILAALYHFGYYEGSQTPPERQPYATSAPLPVTPTQLPLPAEPEPELTEETVVLPASSVLKPAAKPVLEARPSPTRQTPGPTPRAVGPAAPRGLYLQVAALKDLAAARDLESELTTAGFETEVLSPSDDGLIRVISGPYDQRDQARTAARKMSEWGVQPFLREF